MSQQTVCRLFQLAITVAIWLLATACASLPQKLQKPQVELISVSPLNISMSEQKLRFTLNVINPNNLDLPVESMDFIARFNDTNIASGKSQQSTIIPANGQAKLLLDVTAGIDRLTSTLQTLLQGRELNLEYKLTGSVKFKNWAAPIPFNVVGVMNAEDVLK